MLRRVVGGALRLAEGRLVAERRRVVEALLGQVVEALVTETAGVERDTGLPVDVDRGRRTGRRRRGAFARGGGCRCRRGRRGRATVPRRRRTRTGREDRMADVAPSASSLLETCNVNSSSDPGIPRRGRACRNTSADGYVTDTAAVDERQDAAFPSEAQMSEPDGPRAGSPTSSTSRRGGWACRCSTTRASATLLVERAADRRDRGLRRTRPAVPRRAPRPASRWGTTSCRSTRTRPRSTALGLLPDAGATRSRRPARSTSSTCSGGRTYASSTRGRPWRPAPLPVAPAGHRRPGGGRIAHDAGLAVVMDRCTMSAATLPRTALRPLRDDPTTPSDPPEDAMTPDPSPRRARRLRAGRAAARRPEPGDPDGRALRRRRRGQPARQRAPRAARLHRHGRRRPGLGADDDDGHADHVDRDGGAAQPRGHDVHPRRDDRRVRAGPAIGDVVVALAAASRAGIGESWAAASRPRRPPTSMSSRRSLEPASAAGPDDPRRADRDLGRLLRPEPGRRGPLGTPRLPRRRRWRAAAVFLLAMRERAKGRDVRAGTILTVSDVIRDPTEVEGTRKLGDEDWYRPPEEEVGRAGST